VPGDPGPVHAARNWTGSGSSVIAAMRAEYASQAARSSLQRNPK
jgi:hypothetical protein